jgi:hypothetical protein
MLVRNRSMLATWYIEAVPSHSSWSTTRPDDCETTSMTGCPGGAWMITSG